MIIKITSSFKDFNISIEKFLQLPDSTYKEQAIPIIISTHEIIKDKLIQAVNDIKKQDFVLDKIVIIPIEKNI